MKKTLIAIAISTMTATVLSAPVSAAPMLSNYQATTSLSAMPIHHTYKKRHAKRYDHRVLPPHRIVRKLRHKGYRHFTRVRLKNNRYYVVRAVGRRGPVKLIVSAKSGKVIERTRLKRRGYDRGHGFTFGGKRGNWSWSYTIH